MAESVPFLDQIINLINFYKPSSTFGTASFLSENASVFPVFDTFFHQKS